METIWIYQFRLIVIGDSTVGKSCLLHRFTQGRFPGLRSPACDPTVGVDFFSRLLEIEPGKRIKLQLWQKSSVLITARKPVLQSSGKSLNRTASEP